MNANCFRSELLHQRITRCGRAATIHHSWRARRNELTAKAMNTAATATDTPISQWATSRVHARSAEFSQPSAKIANDAPITS